MVESYNILQPHVMCFASFCCAWHVRCHAPWQVPPGSPLNSQESQDDLALASILGSPKRARGSGALLRLLGRLDGAGVEGTWQSRRTPKANRRSSGELGDVGTEGDGVVLLADGISFISWCLSKEHLGHKQWWI